MYMYVYAKKIGPGKTHENQHYYANLKSHLPRYQDYILYSYCAGVDFSRQNRTSVDVRFWRLKSIPAL